MNDIIYPPSEQGVWKAHHFPFLLLIEYLAFAALFLLVGWLLAGMDVSIAFAYFVWALGLCLLMPVLGLQRTTILADRRNNVLTIAWQAWWGGMKEGNTCRLDEIEMIRLCDMRRRYRNGEGFVHGVTLHNWRLWAVMRDEGMVSLLPDGHGSGLFDRRLGKRLAQFVGVRFHKTIWEMPKWSDPI